MRDLLSIGTSRGCEMIGTGIGLGLSGYRLPNALFSPSQISGLQLWLDASDMTTIYQSNGGSLATADGDPVGYWLDKSGNGRNATQTDGTKKPALKKNTLNGKPTIKTDGSNDFFTITPYEPSTLSIFAVVVRRTTSSWLTLAEGTTSNGPLYAWHSNGSVVYYWYSYSPALQVSYAPAASISGPILLARTFNGSNNEVITRQNGTVVDTVTRSGGKQISTIGGSPDWWASDMSFAEYIVFNSILTANETQLIENYLNLKWGVY